MPSVRYYDYGVLRMESDRRMLDAQRRSAQQTTPMRRVTPEWSEQTRPAAGSQPIHPQDAQECEKCDGEEVACRQDRECVPEHRPADRSPIRSGGAKSLLGLSGEELLIAALLVLALSEGCDLPLVLALLYLLM